MTFGASATGALVGQLQGAAPPGGTLAGVLDASMTKVVELFFWRLDG